MIPQLVYGINHHPDRISKSISDRVIVVIVALFRGWERLRSGDSRVGPSRRTECKSQRGRRPVGSKAAQYENRLASRDDAWALKRTAPSRSTHQQSTYMCQLHGWQTQKRLSTDRARPTAFSAFDTTPIRRRGSSAVRPSGIAERFRTPVRRYRGDSDSSLTRGAASRARRRSPTAVATAEGVRYKRYLVKEGFWTVCAPGNSV